MVRTLRAFAWMRWRVLMNSLERTTSRDTVERLSLAFEQIGPWIALVLLVPSGLGLAALGGYAGYWIGSGEPTVMTFDALRILFVVASGLAIVGPMLMPAMERTSAIRLLLLPIPRGTLYVAQASSGISEPWILLVLPAVLAIPVGVALGGSWGGAAVGLIAALLLLLVLLGLSVVSTLVLHLIVRDRRRGELVGLIFIVVVPLLAMIPALLDAQRSREERRADRLARIERQARGEEDWSERAFRRGRQFYAFLPSELFSRATRAATRHELGETALSLLMLGAAGAALHAIGMLTFARLLDSPASGARRRSTSSAGFRSIALPGLSRASAAVAQAHVRLVLRTPRGRSTILSPVLVFLVFAMITRRGSSGMEFGFLNLSDGLGLATFGSAICLLSIQPFAVNQFAIDRAGLTLALLSPLETRELLAGKAAGNALIGGGPALLCVVIALALFPAGPAALWLGLLLGLLATYLLAAPAAAALSAVFPRAVDLNSIGRSSNAHGAAGLLGVIAFVAAGLPPVVLALISTSLMGRPNLVPILIACWCAIALAANRVLFRAVAVLFEKRKENLGLVVK